MEMREILFRGQTRKYGEKVLMGSGEKLPGQWVYGGIFPGMGDFSIIYGWESGVERTGGNLKKLTVYSDTVGEYTGQIDKNGAKIFEGDILLIGNSAKPLLVEFADSSWVCTSRALGPYYLHRLENNSKKYEIIGNIYDNPELIGGGPAWTDGLA